jgi:SecD/SecF fusion protein
MGRRRNLFILLFVVGLTLASVAVILSQPTKLGLDLRGGTSLVYEGQDTPQADVDSESIDRAIEIIRQRVDTLGVAEPEITRVGDTQIDVALPEIQDIERAVDVIGTTAQMHFYDWEPNVIPEDPDDPNATEQGFSCITVSQEQQYKNAAAYCAVIADVTVDRRSGKVAANLAGRVARGSADSAPSLSFSPLGSRSTKLSG